MVEYISEIGPNEHAMLVTPVAHLPEHSNGVTRSLGRGEGLCLGVWDMVHKFYLDTETLPTTSQAVELGKALHNYNINNVKTEYSRYRNFCGIRGGVPSRIAATDAAVDALISEHNRR